MLYLLDRVRVSFRLCILPRQNVHRTRSHLLGVTDLRPRAQVSVREDSIFLRGILAPRGTADLSLRSDFEPHCKVVSSDELVPLLTSSSSSVSPAVASAWYVVDYDAASWNSDILTARNLSRNSIGPGLGQRQRRTNGNGLEPFGVPEVGDDWLSGRSEFPCILVCLGSFFQRV